MPIKRTGTKRNSRLTKVVKSAPSKAVTKRELNKQCRILRLLTQQSSNIFYSGDELEQMLTPTLELLERIKDD